MSEFRQYLRTNIAEMRPVTENEIYSLIHESNDVSISAQDIINGSPKIGDMIARNPLDHKDQWLVAADYFRENFKEML